MATSNMHFSQPERFTLTLGVTPGYFHDNEEAQGNPWVAAARICEVAMAQIIPIQEKTGVILSFMVTPALCGYSREFGCPEGGEVVFTISGERNPLFQPDNCAYREAWIELTLLLKTHFQQTTVRLVEDDVQLRYFTDREETQR